mmetsp:Transcript_16163/g.30002  ORF Transcript_16163/g.30002 Transcript_16163/m.30002 type:complete len:118 (-) Transcript_16163:36-389(-)
MLTKNLTPSPSSILTTVNASLGTVNLEFEKASRSGRTNNVYDCIIVMILVAQELGTVVVLSTLSTFGSVDAKQPVWLDAKESVELQIKSCGMILLVYFSCMTTLFTRLGGGISMDIM